MTKESPVDAKTGRKFYLDFPSDLNAAEPIAFILNLHGGGSSGQWQRGYFPAFDYVDSHRLVIATPTAATDTPFRMWLGEADDAHLQNVCEYVFERFGRGRIGSFWLVGHSQGGMTSNRIVGSDYFRGKVDGWLSLSGGRIGAIELPDSFFGGRPASLPKFPSINGQTPRPGGAALPDADISFIFATGEHEMKSLPETSPWAEAYGAGKRVRLADVVDDRPGYVHDTSREEKSTPAWGLAARPGVAQLYVYPHARDGRLIADVVRLDKGHTEGLEPNITRTLIEMMVGAPGGKLHRQ
ncbi:MAG TPA: hypothetical protein VII56_20465 [Rhizomicrobium sp.]